MWLFVFDQTATLSYWEEIDIQGYKDAHPNRLIVCPNHFFTPVIVLLCHRIDWQIYPWKPRSKPTQSKKDQGHQKQNGSTQLTPPSLQPNGWRPLPSLYESSIIATAHAKPSRQRPEQPHRGNWRVCGHIHVPVLVLCWYSNLEHAHAATGVESQYIQLVVCFVGIWVLIDGQCVGFLSCYGWIV